MPKTNADQVSTDRLLAVANQALQSPTLSGKGLSMGSFTHTAYACPSAYREDGIRLLVDSSHLDLKIDSDRFSEEKEVDDLFSALAVCMSYVENISNDSLVDFILSRDSKAFISEFSAKQDKST